MEKKRETVTIEKATIWKVATVILAVVVVVLFLNKDGTTVPTPAQPGQPQEEFPTVNVDMNKLADDDAFLGNANAPVTIVEFSDYQCPFCAKFWSQTLPSIKSQYIDTGKVRLIYRDFPLLQIHPEAMPAAQAAECAGKQGKYFEMHDKIFQGQTSLSNENYKKWASELGLNTASFNTCLDSGETAAEIQKDLQDGSAVGIQGTPGFIIGKTGGSSGRVISGAYPFASFQQIIDAALAS